MSTAAERQAKYRQKCRESGETVRKNMNFSREAAMTLQRLAEQNGLSQRHMLEKLIMEADENMASSKNEIHEERDVG